MTVDPAIRTDPYDPDWPQRYKREMMRLLDALGDLVTRIEHVGSTSVPGLSAKPIVDIEMQVRALEPLAAYREPLERLGYAFTFDPDMPDLHFFGWPAMRPRRFHIHISQDGSFHFTRVVAVRDYLRAHANVAGDYARVKHVLTSAHPGDTVAYVSGKSDFMRELEARALAWWMYQPQAGHYPARPTEPGG